MGSNFETFCGLICTRSSGINGALVGVGPAVLVCGRAVRIVASVEVCWRVEDALERVIVGLAPGMREVVEVMVGLSSAMGEAAFSIPGCVVVGILSRLQAVVNDIAADRKAARSMRDIFIFQSLKIAGGCTFQVTSKRPAGVNTLIQPGADIYLNQHLRHLCL